MTSQDLHLNTPAHHKISHGGPLLSPQHVQIICHSLCSRPILSYKKSKWTWGTNSKSMSTWASLTPPQREEPPCPELPRGSPWNSDGLLLTSYSILSLLLPMFNFSKKKWKLLLCPLCTMLGLWAFVGAQWSWLWGLSFVSFGLFRRFAVCLECPSQKLSLFLYWINACTHKTINQWNELQYDTEFQCNIFKKTHISANQLWIQLKWKHWSFLRKLI